MLRWVIHCPTVPTAPISHTTPIMVGHCNDILFIDGLKLFILPVCYIDYISTHDNGSHMLTECCTN